METAWYFKLFYIPILSFGISWLLALIAKPKRMTSPGPSKPWLISSMVSFIVFIVLLWFVPFSINLAFWIGFGIIVFGEVVFALGYIAMREHPREKADCCRLGYLPGQQALPCPSRYNLSPRRDCNGMEHGISYVPDFVGLFYFICHIVSFWRSK